MDFIVYVQSSIVSDVVLQSPENLKDVKYIYCQSSGGDSLTFGMGVLMCLFGVCQLGQEKSFGVGNFEVSNVLCVVWNLEEVRLFGV